jgi:hypothetical protein
MSDAVKLKQNSGSKVPGERARLKVIQGPDVGYSFVITGQRASLGRGDENSVVLSDLKTSRVHAEVAFREGGWEVRDLGSSNGIAVNLKNVSRARLMSGDVIGLGETLLEFFAVEAGTQILIAPTKSAAEVLAARERQGRQEERVRQQLSGRVHPPVDRGGSTAGGPQSGSTGRILVILAIAAGVWIFLEQEGKNQGVRRSRKSGDSIAESRDLASMLPQAPSSELSRRADEFFKTGFREFRAGNYLRARQQFETVLQIEPSHEMARRYVENCRIEMEKTAKEYLRRGKNDMSGGKIKEAENQFEAVIRLYHTNQTHELYLTAKAHLEDLKKSSGGK